MNQKEKFAVNMGVLLLGYAYSVNGYETASIVMACTALALAVGFHSANRLFANMEKVMLSALVQILLAQHWELWTPLRGLPVLMIANAVFATLWAESSRKAVEQPLKWFLVGGFVMFVLALALPSIAIPHFAPTVEKSTGALVTFLILIYAPLPISLFFAKRKKNSRKSQILVR